MDEDLPVYNLEYKILPLELLFVSSVHFQVSRFAQGPPFKS